jgi:hypothetical protein
MKEIKTCSVWESVLDNNELEELFHEFKFKLHHRTRSNMAFAVRYEDDRQGF